MYLPGKASELYFWSVFNFFTLPLQREPCGMDVMRWSTEKAIYPPFVPLRSFKKANSLKADWEKEGELERDIDPRRLQLYIKWIKLIKVVHTVCILSTSLKWEAWKTCIQYLMNFHKEMKGKGSVPFRAGMPQQTKWVEGGLNMAEGCRSLVCWSAPKGISFPAISSCK